MNQSKIDQSATTDPASNPLLIQNLFGVHGRIAVITGGGTGLGEMMAQAWVMNGGHVVIGARKEEVLSKTCERLNRLGTGKAEYICADISTKAGCTELCDQLKKKFHKIHVLVNNSGTAIAGDFHQYPEKDPGRVMVIASVQAFNNHSVFGDQGVWSYSSSKAAAVSLSTNLAVTLGPKLITVNAICPGIFPSVMTSELLDQAKDLAHTKHPMGRMGGAEAILNDGGATAAGKCPYDVFEA
ncbi:hypothetical protein VP01_2545g2 [Puccinia sorghi]|uniref:Gluconate 5-dehydrogenase n=1 Tax=Puccinia sorghi TaxID=27349 RepID=A0A0L6V553_9BASI|nr:hypothetical protein VP01_2545g2 [Puccinia sorghi]